MARSIRYHAAFHSDVIASADWYDDRQQGLGVDFTKRVREAIQAIISDPERRTSIEYGLRYRQTERFPYVVFYDLKATEILILGVMHTSQDSGKWLKRRG